MGAACRNSRDTTGVRGGAWCGPIHPDGAPGAHRKAVSIPGWRRKEILFPKPEAPETPGGRWKNSNNREC